MGTARRFEDLEVWRAARDLAREIYKMANHGSFRRDFGLRDQITRAATSTMSNIAEGFERGSRKEFVQFLTIAKASNGEVRSQLYVALDQQYLDELTFTQLHKTTLLLSRRLATFIAYLEGFPQNSRRKRSPDVAVTWNL